MIRLFHPVLAGATWRDRLAASAGGGMGILFVCLLSWLLLHGIGALPLIAAPIGASAVLVFAVPSSPLAQPWAVIGGNTLSAVVGLLVADIIPAQSIVAGLSVGLAILAMSLLRCLHPPGGAVALTAALGGSSVTAAGPLFPLVPIAMNAFLLVLCGGFYHRLSGHSYPHRTPPLAEPVPIQVYGLPEPIDVAAALQEMGETFDISARDLTVLIDRAHVLAVRRQTEITTARHPGMTVSPDYDVTELN